MPESSPAERGAVEGSFSVAQHRRNHHHLRPDPQSAKSSSSETFEDSPKSALLKAGAGKFDADEDEVGGKVHGGRFAPGGMTAVRILLRSRRRLLGLGVTVLVIGVALRSRPSTLSASERQSSASSPRSAASERGFDARDDELDEDNDTDDDDRDNSGARDGSSPGAIVRPGLGPAYGARPLLGSSVFTGTPACKWRAKMVKKKLAQGVVSGGTASGRSCASYHPYVDLSRHIPADEAHAKAQYVATHGMMQAGQPMFADAGDDQPPPPPRGGIVTGYTAKKPQPVLGRSVPLPARNDDTAAAGTGVAFADGTATVLTRRGFGFGHEINQDRAVVVTPYLPLGDGDGRGTENDADTDFIMGVFDGHGTSGHDTAHHAAGAMPGAVAEALRVEMASAGGAGGGKKQRRRKAPEPTREQAKRALAAAFLEVDRTVPELPTSGCTASVAMRLGETLYVANAGDSLTYVVAYDMAGSGNGGDAVSIAYKSRPDKPHLPAERARIEGMGGQVYLPPPWMAEVDSSRVLAPAAPGPDGMIDSYGLAMSRSFGDREVKAVGVVADPIVDALDIRELRRKGQGAVRGRAGSGGSGVGLFVVSVTDGLFDRVTPEVIAAKLAPSLYHHRDHNDGGGNGRGDGDAPPHPLKACEDLIADASKVWMDVIPTEAYRDDITVAVSKII